MDSANLDWQDLKQQKFTLEVEPTDLVRRLPDPRHIECTLLDSTLTHTKTDLCRQGEDLRREGLGGKAPEAHLLGFVTSYRLRSLGTLNRQLTVYRQDLEG